MTWEQGSRFAPSLTLSLRSLTTSPVNEPKGAIGWLQIPQSRLSSVNSARSTEGKDSRNAIGAGQGIGLGPLVWNSIPKASVTFIIDRRKAPARPSSSRQRAKASRAFFIARIGVRLADDSGDDMFTE